MNNQNFIYLQQIHKCPTEGGILRTHDIGITADESNMLNHQLSFLAGFLSCVPRDKIPAPFRRYVERKLFAQLH